MKKLFLFLVVAFMLNKTHAQFVYKIKCDSLLVTNDSCTAELNLENSTKNVKGFLYNKGNGRTEFRRAQKLNDSTLVLGSDTILIGGGVPGLQKVINADNILTQDNNIISNGYNLNLIGDHGTVSMVGKYGGPRYEGDNTPVRQNVISDKVSSICRSSNRRRSTQTQTSARHFAKHLRVYQKSLAGNGTLSRFAK